MIFSRVVAVVMIDEFYDEDRNLVDGAEREESREEEKDNIERPVPFAVSVEGVDD